MEASGLCSATPAHSLARPGRDSVGLTPSGIPGCSPQRPLQEWDDGSHGIPRGVFSVDTRHLESLLSKWRAHTEKAGFCRLPSFYCGEIGIRTLVTVTRQPALQTGALDHSAISPGGSYGSANIAYFLLSCYIAEEKSYSQHKMLSI